MVGVSVLCAPPTVACSSTLVLIDSPGEICAVLRCGSGMDVSTRGGRAAFCANAWSLLACACCSGGAWVSERVGAAQSLLSWSSSGRGRGEALISGSIEMRASISHVQQPSGPPQHNTAQCKVAKSWTAARVDKEVNAKRWGEAPGDPT